MLTPRCAHQLVAMRQAGTMYALGGCSDRMTLSSVECYDANKNTWRCAAPMQRPRFAFGAALGMDGCLYVAGGLDGAPIAECERYDPVSDAWTHIAPLPTRRACVALVCLRGTLYALGGTTNTNRMHAPGVQYSDCEPLRYNTLADAWEVVVVNGSTSVDFGTGSSYACG
jgi:N-acetylneuraminic acid mutarotase